MAYPVVNHFSERETQLSKYQETNNQAIHKMSRPSSPIPYETTTQSRELSAHIGRVARRKAIRESSRGEQSLRLLLAHVRIIDHIESEAALYDEAQSPTSPSPATRGPEYERVRPCKASQRHPSVETFNIESYFAYVVPVSECLEVDIEDWDL